ncbi:isochorismatase [Thalassotalea euphylliae]|uniref:Isochorismatase n=1 Tax=Thalassotalea euphylliae TaxID=1655234 RepID=A0A3E0TLR8_9GAMM|nr:nuclear transport factor 2 family protein [Thalassotalea euphylliae]REL25494.1 isochorismatase [Thalassotalea euphylliae]
MTDQETLALCKAGINAWQTAFNNQDAAGCAAQYTENCVMEAKPIGTFTGRQAIQECWQNIIDQGFKDVVYSNVEWQPAQDGGYILTSSWQMNKAYGVVHREHWVVEADGQARLISDSFEIQGER